MKGSMKGGDEGGELRLGCISRQAIEVDLEVACAWWT